MYVLFYHALGGILMLNMPILKFEKSSNYLKTQLEIQINDKQLILIKESSSSFGHN